MKKRGGTMGTPMNCFQTSVDRPLPPRFTFPILNQTTTESELYILFGTCTRKLTEIMDVCLL